MNDLKITINIKLVKSFTYRNTKNIPMKNVDLSEKVEDFIEGIKRAIQTANIPPPFKQHMYDTLKVSQSRWR